MTGIELGKKIFGMGMFLVLCVSIMTIISFGATAATGNGTVDITFGTTPTIDGTISAGEYADAATTTIQMAGGATGTVYYKYDSTTLYTACTETYWFETYLDLNNNGASAPDTNDWLFHTCGALYTQQGTGAAWGPEDNSLTGWSTAVNQHSEQAITFSKLGITAGQAKTMGVMFLVVDYGSNPMSEKFWPATSNRNNPSTWAEISSSMNWGEVNDPPVVSSPISPITMDEDDVHDTLDLDTVFSDPEAQTMAYSHDKMGINKDNIQVTITNGVVYFRPDEDWNGQETVTFYANDGSNPAVETSVTVTVTPVNDAPEVSPVNLDFSIDEDTIAENRIDLTTVFSDVDTDPTLNENPQNALTYTHTTGTNIEVSLSSNKASFTPAENWHGEETFTFTANDGITTATKDVKVTVTSVKDAPEVTQTINDITMAEDPTEEVINAHKVDLNTVFKDNDGDKLTFSVSGGTFVKAEIDKLGILSFTPEENFHGMETITVTASDGTTEAPASTTVNVKVTSVNDEPVLETVEDWILTEDEAFTYTFGAEDQDGDELLYTLNIPEVSDYELNTKTGSFSLTPGNSMVGTYKATLTVDDQTGTATGRQALTFNVEIKNVNNAPEASITMPETNSKYEHDEKVTLVGECTDIDTEVEENKEVVFYVWTSDLDGELGTGPKVNDLVLSPGTHSITLTTTDKAGESDTKSILVVVKAAPEPDPEDEEPEEKKDREPQEELPEVTETGDKEAKSSLILPIMIVIVLVILLAAIVIVLVVVMTKKGKKKGALPEPKADTTLQTPAQTQAPQPTEQEYLPPQ